MEKIFNLINQSKNILLILHSSPDGDSLGANLAMTQYLKSLNKNVTLISGDSKIPINYKKLPHVDQIIEKNIFQINLSDFDLFLVLDCASFDQVTKLGKINIPNTLKIINIDHHVSNKNFGNINYVKKNAPATCEIIYNLFSKWKVKIDNDIAAFLIVGIYDDSLFKYHNTTYKTFKIASKLAKICPNFNNYLFDIDNSNSPEKIKFLGVALSNIETYFDNQVAIASVPFELMEKNSFPIGTTDDTDINNILKSVIGWNIGINFFEYQKNKIKVGFRTRDSNKWNVSLIAKALGGGGHVAASGANLNMPFADAKKLLLDKLQEIYKL